MVTGDSPELTACPQMGRGFGRIFFSKISLPDLKLLSFWEPVGFYLQGNLNLASLSPSLHTVSEQSVAICPKE